MGLDWNPANKPKPGLEDEFWDLFDLLSRESFDDNDPRLARFHEISITAFETLNAPRVGIDAQATDWARKIHAENGDKTPVDKWLAEIHGVYVVGLAPPCDGIPRYSNGSTGGYVEPFSFRAQVLESCQEIIGEELLNRAWNHMRPLELRDYGLALQESARRFALEKDINLDAIDCPEDDESLEFQLDVVASAGRWCLFWAGHGHPLEAYF